jgi:hypothetical protein
LSNENDGRTEGRGDNETEGQWEKIKAGEHVLCTLSELRKFENSKLINAPLLLREKELGDEVPRKANQKNPVYSYLMQITHV